MEILEIKNENNQKKKKKQTLSGWIWFHIQNVISLEVITPTLKKSKNKQIENQWLFLDSEKWVLKINHHPESEENQVSPERNS